MDKDQQNYCCAENLTRTFFLGCSLIGQAALWLSGLLALLGLFWRERSLADGPQAGPVALALAVLVVGVLYLSYAFPVRRYRETPNDRRSVFRLSRKHALLIPALTLGLILPPLLFVPYAVFLGLFEFCCRKRSADRSRFSRLGTVLEAGNLKTEDAGEAEEEFDDESENEFDENTLQQTVRRRTEDGRDRLEVSYAVLFAEEQLTAVVHIPFCPVFETVPKVEAFLLDENSAKIILADPEIFGIRIEVKRDRSASNRLHLAVVAEETRNRSED